MTVSDPLGDMLTRIRNAQMRSRPKVSTPASKLRARVLDVLREEGYIRGYAEIVYGGGKTEFEIELKYYDGTPVIREIKRVSTPGRRVYSSVAELPTIANGLGRCDPIHAQRCDVGYARPRRKCGRRDFVQRVLGAQHG